MKDLETGLYWNRNSQTIEVVQPDGTKKRTWTRWNSIGTVYNKRGPAESQVTSLTRTSIDKRDTDAKIVLYGNEKVARYRVVECDIVDKE